jgi:hypothetical protein
MSFVSDVGRIGPETVVKVKLDRQANVKLVDSSNLSKYREGLKYKFYGGHAVNSPVELHPPKRRHWHVIIDGVDSVRASVTTSSAASSQSRASGGYGRRCVQCGRRNDNFPTHALCGWCR